jgi:extracellular factor (EF) 3-hydroxypalmitic acid methyl ester biosynthesis protein
MITGPLENSSPLILDNELRQLVSPFAKTVACKKGQELVTTGDQSQCFYFIEKGSFEVSYKTEKTSIVVALIGAGSIFGEIGYFDHMTRTRNIHAVEDAEVQVFNQQVMDAIRARNPDVFADFMEFLLRSVCYRFRQILTDRGPLSSYAALLSTGKEQFEGLQPLPVDLLGSAGWQQVSLQLEDFKAALFDISYRLQKDDDENIPPELQVQGEAVLERFKGEVRQYGEGMQAQYLPLMWGYVFKELFPYFMRSRLAERAYYKPKGFAGDFKMMEHIYRMSPDGDGKLGRLIDGWLLKQVPPQAVRNRRWLLSHQLDRLCRERLNGGRHLHIMNLACGPCRELFDFLVKCNYSENVNALCVDIDSEALQYADRHVNTASHQAAIRFMNENVIKWALGRAKHDLGLQDIIYSSGLCDYLDRRLMTSLIERCHAQLNSGGALVIGNFTPVNPDRRFMDNIMYWRLIHRDEQEMRQLFADSPFGDQVQFITEEEGVNLFAVATKG